MKSWANISGVGLVYICPESMRSIAQGSLDAWE